MGRRRDLIGLVVLASTIIAACGSSGVPASATSRQTAMLTIGIGADPDTLDPMRQTTTLVENVVEMVVESLAFVELILPHLSTPVR